MSESKLGEQRARVVEGELTRLRQTVFAQTRYINHQGRAIQTIGDALTTFVAENRAEYRRLEARIERMELPFWRRWWMASKAYVLPVWYAAQHPDFVQPTMPDEPDAIRPEDVQALEQAIGTSLRPEPGDEALINEVAKALHEEQQSRPTEMDAETEKAAAVAEAYQQAVEDLGPDNVRPFRGKVTVQ